MLCWRQLRKGEVMPGVVHFEISVDDMERAIAFYTEVFNWRIRKQNEEVNYWLIEGDHAPRQITGALTPRSLPVDSTIITFDVASLDDSARKITRAGGKVLRPKDPLPGVGYVQYCEDSEGNLFAIL